MEGRNAVALDYRWADGRNDRIAEIAAEFVRLKVDIIVTGGNAVLAIKKLTSTIPVVFAVAVDPVGSGFVDNLSRPGANVTGLSIQGPDLAGKRAELLREVIPGLRRMAVMANVAYPAAKQELAEVQAAAHALGVEVIALEIRGEQDIAPAFEGLKERAEALYIASEALVDAKQVTINELALGARLPTIWGSVAVSKAADSCPMDRASRLCSDGRPITSIRYSAGPSRPIYQSNSRPSSNS